MFHQTTLDNAAQAARKLYTTRHTSAQKILAVYRTHGPQVEKARLAALEAEQSATAEGTTDAEAKALHTEAKARYAECARILARMATLLPDRTNCLNVADTARREAARLHGDHLTRTDAHKARAKALREWQALEAVASDAAELVA